ncbi:hypothetical protein LSH36_995g00006 [Paralvinella palmiformis]|uniref:Uncharacterized protein n=1 Tax=Paralvinella palmiformis TaxID=53620 RepID=A0AAD9IWD4_9ANNE|nr:hypothetical protein LSH36_995g00006 [Paralvinella palmiformis]
MLVVASITRNAGGPTTVSKQGSSSGFGTTFGHLLVVPVKANSIDVTNRLRKLIVTFVVMQFCSDTGDRSDDTRKAEAYATARYSALKDKVENNYTMRESDLLQYVEKLRTGCTAGIDGITAERIKSNGPKIRSV